MRIGLIGVGVVGSAARDVFSKYHTVLCYDKFKTGPGLAALDDVVMKSDVLFISVPTPMGLSGAIDLTAVKEAARDVMRVIKEQGESSQEWTIVIRSTAVSGTTDELAKKHDYPGVRWAFNPEFLTAAHPTEDFRNADRVVIGANDKPTFEHVAQVYRESKFACPILHLNIRSAEFLKYCSNAALATKVILSNELYQIAERLDVDWDSIRYILEMDPRLGKGSTQVPGPDGDFGFGLLCLPKDINALISLAREHGYRPDFLEEVWRSNLKFRHKLDWLPKDDQTVKPKVGAAR